MAARRASHPPIPNEIPKGAVCFRDARLWHRGVPHVGALPRHMIALIYKQLGPSSAEPPPLLFSEDAAQAFAGDGPRAAVCEQVSFPLAFAAQPVDMFGNRKPEVGGAPKREAGKEHLNLEKQYRKNFWMPSELLTSLWQEKKGRYHALREEAALPRWVRDVADGKVLRRDAGERAAL